VRNQHGTLALLFKAGPSKTQIGTFTMARLAILTAFLLFAFAVPASAQHVIYNPGWCAQLYPNANCQNYGPGNPYTSWGWRYAYGRYDHYPRRFHHRYRRY
jgi:hypothetical protein